MRVHRDDVTQRVALMGNTFLKAFPCLSAMRHVARAGLARTAIHMAARCSGIVCGALWSSFVSISEISDGDWVPTAVNAMHSEPQRKLK